MMVSDSRTTVHPDGPHYPTKKIHRVGDKIVGAAGEAGDCVMFIKWAAKDFSKPEPKWMKGDTIALVLDKDGIYIWSVGDPEPEKIEMDHFAIGSGGDAARGALMAGLDPEEAVKIAIEVDRYSGGPIQKEEL